MRIGRMSQQPLSQPPQRNVQGGRIGCVLKPEIGISPFEETIEVSFCDRELWVRRDETPGEAAELDRLGEVHRRRQRVSRHRSR